MGQETLSIRRRLIAIFRVPACFVGASNKSQTSEAKPPSTLRRTRKGGESKMLERALKNARAKSHHRSPRKPSDNGRKGPVNARISKSTEKRPSASLNGSQEVGSRRNSSGGEKSSPMSRSRNCSSREKSSSMSRSSRDRSSSISRSTSRSVSKFRDFYVQSMLKVADLSSQHGSSMAVGIGSQVDRDSQVFESEVFRKRSSQEGEVMDHYWQNSIRPDEWQAALSGGKVIRHMSL